MKAKYNVSPEYINSTVYNSDGRLVLKTASQKQLEVLYKKKYQGVEVVEVADEK